MKLAIVVRTDLGMSKGKIAVQVGHASLASYVECSITAENIQRLNDWYKEGQKKIVLKCGSLDEMIRICDAANSKNLETHIIHDFGLTQVEPNTPTCVAIGPGTDEEIDDVISGLKLL